MTPTPFSALTVPSALNVMFEMIAFGLAKCVVFVTLKHSALNCSVDPLFNVNVRNRLMSRLGAVGPRKLPRPAFPNLAVVTGLNAVTSKYWQLTQASPEIFTGPSVTLSANCVVVPGAFSDALLELT